MPETGFVDDAFYWVRWREGCWDVARYDVLLGEKRWLPIGDSEPHLAEDFAEIGPCLGDRPPTAAGPPHAPTS